MPVRSHNKASEFISFLLLFPIIFLVAIVPLIVRVKLIPIDDFLFDFWKNERQYADIFSYYKSIWTIVTGGICTLIFAALRITNRLSINKASFYVPTGIFALFIILSSIFSEHVNNALAGFPDRFEGMWVQLAYLIIFITAANLIHSERQLWYILSGLFATALIIAVIGIFQFFGHDLFKSAFGIQLILPREYYGMLDTIKQKAGDSTHYIYSMYSTLYNSNSFGMYMAMLFPLTAILSLTASRKHIKIALGASSFMMFVCLIGSNSRGAWLGALLAVAAAIIPVMLRKQIKVHFISILAISFCCLIIFVFMNYKSGGNLFTRLGFGSAAASSVFNERNMKISDFSIKGNELTLYFGSDKLIMVQQNNNLIFQDNNGHELELQSTSGDNKYVFNNKRYEGFSIGIDKNLISIVKQNSLLRFAAYEGGLVFVDAKGKIVKEFKPVNAYGFRGMEQFASSRGYIWSRTLPLLKNTLILGHGPDTFAFYFPQYDYMGKLQYMYDANIIIDKPHNLYLQIAVNTGTVSLLAFLAILSFYYFNTISIVIKNDPGSSYKRIALAILAAVTGYLIAGLFTDSTISVSPVFWALLGVGMGIAYRTKHNIISTTAKTTELSLQK